MNEIIAQINQRLANSFGFEEEEIQPDFELRGDLNASELELSDAIAQMEQAFDIEISAQEIRTMTTVSELYELILDKLNEIS